MDKRTLGRRWDFLRQAYGIYLRVLETIPESKLQEHVIPGMRTPAELVAHTSGAIVRNFANGLATGEIKDEEDEATAAAALTTRAKAVAYARQCWHDADAAMSEVGDVELEGTVASPWGMSFSGTSVVNMMHDEFIHHRGQLYAYARASGGEPPFVWSFAENAPEFAPKS